MLFLDYTRYQATSFLILNLDGQHYFHAYTELHLLICGNNILQYSQVNPFQQ